MPPPLPHPYPPSGFEGVWLTGEAAALQASQVSGPWHSRPLAVARPQHLEDLRLLVRHAREEEIALVPRGAGTGMPGGTSGAGIVVSLDAFDGFSDPAPQGTIRAGAGAIAGLVDRRARSLGLHLPPLPSSSAWCTVGGMVANNAAGARSFGLGATAPWVRGLRGVDSEGNSFGAGSLISQDAPPHSALDALVALRPALEETYAHEPWPRVRKNSSGYALDRWLAAPSSDPLPLLVGSEGTLALLTEVEFGLATVPHSQRVALLPVVGPHEAARMVEDVRAHGLPLSACEFLGRRFLEISGLEDHPELGALARKSYALLLVELSGREEAVSAGLFVLGDLYPEAILGSTREATHALWELRHAASPMIAREAERGLVSTQFIEDSVVPPARIGEYLVELEAILLAEGVDAVIFGHAGDGNLHVNPLLNLSDGEWRGQVTRILGAVAGLVRRLEGTLTGEHGDGRIRAPYLKSIWGGSWVSAFQQIKDAFDPQGRLNPGVILPVSEERSRSPGDLLEGFTPRPRSWPL